MPARGAAETTDARPVVARTPARTAPEPASAGVPSVRPTWRCARRAPAEPAVAWVRLAAAPVRTPTAPPRARAACRASASPAETTGRDAAPSDAARVWSATPTNVTPCPRSTSPHRFRSARNSAYSPGGTVLGFPYTARLDAFWLPSQEGQARGSHRGGGAGGRVAAPGLPGGAGGRRREDLARGVGGPGGRDRPGGRRAHRPRRRRYLSFRGELGGRSRGAVARHQPREPRLHDPLRPRRGEASRGGRL